MLRILRASLQVKVQDKNKLTDTITSNQYAIGERKDIYRNEE